MSETSFILFFDDDSQETVADTRAALMADIGNASVTVCARFRPENDIERDAKGAKAVAFAEVGGKG